MAKLKFDRSINMIIEKGESAKVPDDEVWKVTGAPLNKLRINDQETTGTSNGTMSMVYILGGGYPIKCKK